MNNLYKVVEYTAFGKTKRVRAELHNMAPDEEPDEYLWVERPEDYYALMSSKLKNKKVAIINRNEWLKN